MGLLGFGSMDRRFFHALGASLLDRTICASAGAHGFKATVGKTMGFDPEAIVHARLIVAWGANMVSSNVHLWPFVEEARRRGARLVCVDPFRSRTAEKSDLHLAPYPGTDAALALGMMHVAFRDGLEDRDWLERHTVGHEELRERAQEWTPARTAATTGLRAEEIESFAREYATTRPSAIRLNYGLNRHAGGGMAVRTVACLPAVVGAWRDVGGGALLSTSGTFPVDTAALERPDLVPPGTRTLNMSQLGRILTDASLDPPVAALFVYNSNPAAVAPEQDAVRRGLEREDLFVVVHEQFQTDTADFADILLPATTTLEHYDIHKAYGHLYVSLSRPAIAPLGEALPNTELFRRLAARMGLDHPCLRESDEQMARQSFKWDHPFMAGITFDRLEREGSVRLSVPEPFAPFREGGFPTASGKCELVSERLGAEGHDPVAGYTPPREGPTSAPELAKRHPLAFISPPAHHFLNSTFSSQAIFAAARRRRERHDPPRGRRPSRHRGGGHGARLQRPRVLPRPSPRLRRGAAGCRGGPLDLVGQALPRRPQRQRRHQPGADRHGRRRHLLRRAGRRRPGSMTTCEPLEATGLRSAAGFTPAQASGGSGGATQHPPEQGKLVGGFIGATVVTLLQFVRVRDRRLLLLAAMFAFQAQALAREWYDVWRDVFQIGVCAAGLGLLFALSPRRPHPAPPPPPPPGPPAA